MKISPYSQVLLGLTATVCLSCSSTIPRGQAGQPAQNLVERMLQSVDTQAWERTGAVAWTFAGRHSHLWDRTRHFAEVRWGEHRAIIDINGRRGLAWDEEEPLVGEDLQEALDDAHGKWINDSFWLNPVAKAVDPGTRRERVILEDGREALLVKYLTGGRTPGDAYLWLFDPDGRPNEWRMWVSILPVGGVRASWDGWTRLETGAWVSTRHETSLFDLELTDVKGAASLEDLVSPDPFVPLLSCASTAAVTCGTF